MILEGVITTVSANGQLNIAPMGPHFLPGADSFELRPFETSLTYRNLCENQAGVFHVTDDCLLIARSAVNQLQQVPDVFAAKAINGRVIENCCRYFEFTATEIANVQSRKTFHCSIIHKVNLREFYGFNRAKHAVLEATILATRIDFIPVEEIKSAFSQLKTIVEKTGGADEHLAFSLLERFVSETAPTSS